MNIDTLVKELVAEIKKKVFVPIEASGRHIHLCRTDVERLFGKGYQLTRTKDLSQPGQFACQERLTLCGPKGEIKNVVILGPERKASQVEISMTDARLLGIEPVVRQSGEITNTPGATLRSADAEVQLDHGVIVARRHIHMIPEDAKRFGVKDQDIVRIKAFGSRPLIFDDVVVRVSDQFHTDVHIDYDEANACGFKNGMLGILLKAGEDG